MIKQKGVIEYVNAIRKLNKEQKKKCFFYLIGSPDPNNPSSISINYLRKLNKFKQIKYIPHTENIQKFILQSDVIVLPSYGEGLPATLLEALFFKKAIITTKVNGCKELVKNNYNGYSVNPRNSDQIYQSFKKIIYNPKILIKFKKNSYRLFEKKFNQDSIGKYIKIYNSI